MKLELYEVARDYVDAIERLGEIEGLTDDVISDTVESLAHDVETSVLNMSAFIKNLDAEVSAMRSYEIAMRDRRKAEEMKRDRLISYVKEAMRRCNIKKVKSNELSVTLRKPTYSVTVDSIAKIPAKFKETKIEYKVDKASLKEFMRLGGDVEGATLHMNPALIIK